MADLAAASPGVVDMTAFTYRFTPALRYMRHLVASGALGAVRHFRANRFLDWPETSWGWRQYKKTAGAGNLYDMMTHRVDYAAFLLGSPIASVCGSVARFAPRTAGPDGAACAPSEVDDWSAILGHFANGATGVWEGSTLMKGHHNGGLGKEWAEINGSEQTVVYELSDPSRVLLGAHGESLRAVPVPSEFGPRAVAAAKAAGRSLPGEKQSDPSFTFRYDLVYEFVDAICTGRAAEPGFDAGAVAQEVCDAVLESFDGRKWVDLEVGAAATGQH
jgi:predicted dehydrogenase